MATNRTILSQYMDTSGDGTGTTDASADYSVATGTPTHFYIAPPAGTKYVIRRVIITIADGAAMSADEYGGLAGVLTGGITVLHTEDDNVTTLVDITDGIPITMNGEWNQLTGNHVTEDFDGAAFTLTWTLDLGDFMEDGLTLDGDNNETLSVFVTGDTSGLSSQFFLAQGYSFAVGD